MKNKTEIYLPDFEKPLEFEWSMRLIDVIEKIFVILTSPVTWTSRKINWDIKIILKKRKWK